MTGEFKNGLLHGNVISYSKDGELINIMKYRKGKIKKYIYLHGKTSTKYLQYYTKKLDGDPIKMTQTITR